MSNIKFVSHEEFPEDPYIKEVCYLLIEEKYRVAYFRRQAKNGGLFWGAASVGVSKNGGKVYFEAFMQDSSFLEKDIKAFLEGRSWGKPIAVSASVFSDEEVPF